MSSPPVWSRCWCGGRRTRIRGCRPPARGFTPTSRGRSSAEEPAARPIQSFLRSTKVLLADGSAKSISSLRVGDRVANSQPGKAGLEAHPVDRVIVTETDHDFVDLKVQPNRIRRAVGRVAAGLAVAAAVVTGGAATASAAPATVTTTCHHPF